MCWTCCIKMFYLYRWTSLNPLGCCPGCSRGTGCWWPESVQQQQQLDWLFRLFHSIHTRLLSFWLDVDVTIWVGHIITKFSSISNSNNFYCPIFLCFVFWLWLHAGFCSRGCCRPLTARTAVVPDFDISKTGSSEIEWAVVGCVAAGCWFSLLPAPGLPTISPPLLGAVCHSAISMIA